MTKPPAGQRFARPLSTRTRVTPAAGTFAFTDTKRAEGIFAHPRIVAVIAALDDAGGHGRRRLVSEIAATPDPDQCLLGLVRWLESVSEEHSSETVIALAADHQRRRTLLTVMAVSQGLVEFLVRRPQAWLAVAEAPATPDRMWRDLATVLAVDDAHQPRVSSLPIADAMVALRHWYFENLLRIAAFDIAAPDPQTRLPQVGLHLANLADTALEGALAIARTELPDHGHDCALAMIAMGKCGAQELNYISDVDVIFAVGPANPRESNISSTDVVRQGAALAGAISRICSASTPAGSLWTVDANLRPEGTQGPLVRTIDSFQGYYERWAKTWEFQALLKARPAAGDKALGQEFIDLVQPMVWNSASREGFVMDVQAMRQRVEEHLSPQQAPFHLKLGPGGLRDIEFSVQLLQLVHGRTDPTVRSANTLTALQALTAGGYISRDDTAVLDPAYRTLRVLEHALQLRNLRRTAVLPSAPADNVWLDRYLRVPSVLDLWRKTGRQVRALHEQIFYRPLLASVARLSTDEVRLTPAAARDRLTALGYRDPGGALTHISALTAGLSRRAAIQRHLLPVLLEWFAKEANPDAGLLAFRKLSDALGSTHWYLQLLRDSTVAARRLAHAVGASTYVAERLERTPQAVQWFGEDASLRPRALAALNTGAQAVTHRSTDAVDAVMKVRSIRRREALRTAMADLTGLLNVQTVGESITDIAAMSLQSALTAVLRSTPAPDPSTAIAVIGMGRLGGREMSYASDADVMVVGDADQWGEKHRAWATHVVNEWVGLLRSPGSEPPLEVDLTLRPEGKRGPVVRSFASFADYYQRWGTAWERQALVRAAPIAGDQALGERFVALIDPRRYPLGGLAAQEVKEIRSLKARMESERLPRGVEPRRHLKLGPGGLSDVEWAIQLLQLQHAHDHPALRTTSTVGALTAARDLHLLSEEDSEYLSEAWTLASRIRNALLLTTGRGSDVLPADPLGLAAIAQVLGYKRGQTAMLADDYQRCARRARVVMERVFYP